MQKDDLVLIVLLHSKKEEEAQIRVQGRLWIAPTSK